MPATFDIATLEGHIEPFKHLAESIVYDTDSVGTTTSVKEAIMALEADGVIETAVPCAAGVFVGSFVYIDGTGTLQLGLADDISTARLVGVVVADAGSTCSVKQVGPVDGFVGLTPGVKYFLSATSAGDPSATVPTTTGHVVHSVGIALSTTTLYVNTNVQPTIRS